MTFTDDDLKRLKEFIQARHRYAVKDFSWDSWDALLARLEAEIRCRKYLETFDLGELKEGDRVSWVFPKEFYIAMREALLDCDKACGK